MGMCCGRAGVVGGLLFGLLAWTGCQPGDPVEPEAPRIDGAWHRVDLWRTLEQPPAGVEAILAPMADPEGLRKARVPGRVRAVSTPLRRPVTWGLELGSEPSLRFTPLRAGASPTCRYRYRVGVQTSDGQLHELVAMPEPRSAPRWEAPAAIELALDDFADQSVTLTLQADPWSPTCGTGDLPPALWGEPGVAFRTSIPAPPPDARLPNLVLVSFDALRFDAVGASSSQVSGDPAGGPTLASPTPNLDRLIDDGLSWAQAFATFNGTNPSFASMLTGLYGKNHGVYDLRTPLPDDHRTLAEILTEQGYSTAAVVSARHLAAESSGLHQGFDHFVAPETLFAPELAVDQAIEWLAEQDGPFFLWLHLFEPHTPHRPPRPYADGYRPDPTGMAPATRWRPFRAPSAVGAPRRMQLGGHEALYQGEVAAADRHLGRLLDFLASRALLDEGWLAVVSDHGENLLERTEGPEAGVSFRHVGLWDSTLHVPLVLWGNQLPQEQRGMQVASLVQTLDLFPTLLGLAGAAPPPSDGRDLLEMVADPSRGRRAIFAEHMGGQGVAIRTDSALLARFQGHPLLADGERFYDLADDPAQLLPASGLAQEHPDQQRLAQALDAWLSERRDRSETVSRSLDPSERQQLEALGYLDP